MKTFLLFRHSVREITRKWNEYTMFGVVRLMCFCVSVRFSNGRELLHVAGATIEENQFPSHLQRPQNQLPVE